MNNRDKYQAAMDNKNYIEAATMAFKFSRACGSKSTAWSWADRATDALTLHSPALGRQAITALGDLSWPDIKAAEELIPEQPNG